MPSTAHALRLLLTKLRGLAPDIVTVRLGHNDHTLLSPQPWWPSGGTPYDLLRVLPAGAFEWRVVRLAVDAYQRVTAPQPALPSTYRVPIDEFERNLIRLIETVRRMGEASCRRPRARAERARLSHALRRRWRPAGSLGRVAPSRVGSG